MNNARRSYSKECKVHLLATNAMINNFQSCENEVFVDIIKNHIIDGVPFEEEDIMQWDKEEGRFSNGCGEIY